MTEPREPESVPEVDPRAGEQPLAAPDPGTWYPVSSPPQPDAEPAETPAADESVETPAADEPAETPAADEPAETPATDEPTVAVEAPASTSSPSDSPDAEPTVAIDEPPSPFAEPTLVAQTERLTIPDAPAETIFRAPSPASAPSPEPTRVEALSEEERRLAAERSARKEATAAALAAPAPQAFAAPAPVVVHKRTNDKFWGSLGLFLLRVVLAGIFTVRGLNILADIPAATKQFEQTLLVDVPPGPQLWAIITGVASLLIALALLLGLLTRVAGLGIALIAGAAVALVYWSPNWSPFVAGQPGFLGEYQLLLATVGVLLLFIGGGGWSLDRSSRAGRERNRSERASAGQ